MKELAIRTESLSRDFASLRAIDQLTLEVPSQMIFGFLGPNGSGKTTTIRLLLGLLEASHGRAEVLGYDTRTHGDEIRARTGALLEHSGLYERLTAEDNLDFYGRIWHMPTAERQARTQELLTHLGLWERRRELVNKWSRGMKQKLAIARTLFHRPQLIFLDEPTAGLDPIAAAQLREELADLVAQEGVTVFLTTHNLAEAEKLCQQVGVIRQGKLLAVGSLDELRARKGSTAVHITGHNFPDTLVSTLQNQPEVAHLAQKNGQWQVALHRREDTSAVVGLIVGAGGRLDEVRQETASLEELFLSLMEEEK